MELKNAYKEWFNYSQKLKGKYGELINIKLDEKIKYSNLFNKIANIDKEDDEVNNKQQTNKKGKRELIKIFNKKEKALKKWNDYYNYLINKYGKYFYKYCTQKEKIKYSILTTKTINLDLQFEKLK